MATPDEERLANELVENATAPYAPYLTPSALKEMRDHLVAELLCTSYGRARLRRVLDRGTVHKSEELPIEAPAVSPKKEGTGGT
jgi:hypothetical protein